MRTACFRTEDGRDWGLPARRRAQIYQGLLSDAARVAADGIFRRRELQRLRRTLRRHRGRPVLLSIGSGRTVPPGWIGIDRKRGSEVFSFDLNYTIPFDRESVDGVLCEHILEHFPLDDLPNMLRDYHRVMKPGAPIRLVSPDAFLVADLINNNQSERTRRQIEFDADVHRWDDSRMLRWKVINRLTYQFGQHQSLLTEELATDLLEHSGFSGVKSVTPFTTEYFTEPPTTHFLRFPDSHHEVFGIEAVK
jgi:predicted SAM-dependent methyltransferase